jgi:quercetin dioxygenase-like cupin family protein
MLKPEHKDFKSADDVRAFEKGKVELLNFGDSVVGRFTLEPGWRWSDHIKHIAETDLCEMPHFAYHVSGRLHIQMQDGTEFEVGPGQVATVPSGHDAWVVGNEPVVMVDWSGATHYAEGN